jgi:hypothetical protein
MGRLVTMRTSKLANMSLIGMASVLLLVQFHVRGEDVPKSSPVPDDICTKLKVLFQKYYPKAMFTNLQVNGVHVEYEVATFEFPRSASTAKQENPIQRGPKQGGILCNIYLEKGEYRGQLALIVPDGVGQFGSYLIDRKVYKQLLMAPYSAKRDAHLWVSLSYPSDASENFLKEFRALMKDFVTDTR